MHSFKKAILTTVIFLLAFSLFSFAIIAPYYSCKTYLYQDSDLRDELSGSVNYLICGASHAQRGFDTSVLDAELGVNSYNLGGSLMSMRGRYVLLEKELNRNPVDTIILELSCNTMIKSVDAEYEGNYYELARMGSLGERLRFFFTMIRPADYGKVYYHALRDGVSTIRRVLTHNYSNDTGYDKTVLKGYYPWVTEPKDLSMSLDELRELENTETLSTEYSKTDLYWLRQIIELGKSNGAEVVVVVTPISDRYVYKFANLDEVCSDYESIALENGLRFYDFNLSKECKSILDESTSFMDEYHLSESGAEVFTTFFAEFMTRASIGAVDENEFFESYAEMKEMGVQ